MAFLLLLAYVGIAAFAVSVVQLFWLDDKQYGIHALVGLGVFVTCRLTAFVLARSLTCPLCHGTVMHEKRCRKHAEAFRIPTLTYRFSAVLSILLTWGFRCMYCGTQYRLRR